MPLLVQELIELGEAKDNGTINESEHQKLKEKLKKFYR